MPSDDLVVGRCEGLGDAKMPTSFGVPGWELRIPHGFPPLEAVSIQIEHAEKQAKAIQAKLDALYALRSKLADPECAKAVKDALELLR